MKLAFARQVGDEAKHYRLISERLDAASALTRAILIRARADTLRCSSTCDALQSTVGSRGRGPVHARSRGPCAQSMLHRVLRSARRSRNGGPLPRSAYSRTNSTTTSWGGRCLRATARPPTSRTVARQAARRTLELAEEIQEMARLKAGISARARMLMR